MHVRPSLLATWSPRPPLRWPLGLPPLGRCAAQCSLAALCLAGIALSLDAWLHTTVVAALGATTFIVFATPHAPAARSRAIGAGALSVGLCAFLMLLTRTAHPPAAGVALHLALSPWDAHTLLFLGSAITLLALARHTLDRRLRDLA